ncbi:Oidioi.mRNA.OKI2018_I69.PAR.g9409.t1.cds [Oikopleura dioica]|uniref:Oidioi.mRNA.OKI2018_I69.PAR.g9409.t1.cds n=1 Tax=Oikopleura dioica TaxID=34765 RepID=A0ABN7RKC6_OIKDI|nr:Oidioi.mRNA.OKI2018_I69.PAR.g9409.t1.cds [Oikopleura dioica]
MTKMGMYSSSNLPKIMEYVRRRQDDQFLLDQKILQKATRTCLDIRNTYNRAQLLQRDYRMRGLALGDLLDDAHLLGNKCEKMLEDRKRRDYLEGRVRQNVRRR